MEKNSDSIYLDDHEQDKPWTREVAILRIKLRRWGYHDHFSVSENLWLK